MPTTTDTAILDQLASRAGSLYSLPAVALEILQLTNSPKVEVHALKDRIECDPALTTKILRTVNSSVFGLSGKVSDLNQAIALLGIKSLKMLALGFSLPKTLFEEVDKDVLLHYWRHTLTRAVACRELCRTMRSKFGDETFIAALLQDLGVLVLIQELGDPYSHLYQRACNDHYDLAMLEYRATGFDHTQLTGRLLRNWSLPEVLISTIDTNPHVQMPLSPEVLQQRAILAVAEKVALVLADGRSDELNEALRLAKESLRIQEEPFFEAISRIEELVLQLGDILSLKLPDGLGYDDLLSEARHRMREISSSLQSNTPGQDLSPEEYALLEADLQNVTKKLTTVMDHKRPQEPAGEMQGATISEKVPKIPSRHADHFETIPAKAATTAQAVEMCPIQGKFEVSSSHYELLLDRVGKAIVLCRQKRIPLSLLVSDVVIWDGGTSIRDVNSTEKRFALDRLLGNARNDLEQACGNLDHPFYIISPFGENGVAMVLLDCERKNALELADEMVRSMPREYGLLSNQKVDEHDPRIRLGIGIASASSISPNFLANGLIEGAQRCLHASLTTAGRAVKSIEVF